MSMSTNVGYEMPLLFCLFNNTYEGIQGYEPKVEIGSVGFSVSHQKSVVFGRFFYFLTEKNETQTEHFSVGLSVGFSAKPAKW